MLAERGQLSFARRDNRHSPRAQELEVGLRRRVLVHPVVHRGGGRDRAGGRERGCRQEIVGLTIRKLRERVGTRRRDQIDVGALDELEVADRRPLAGRLAGIGASKGVGLKLVAEHRRAGDRLKRGLPDELLAGLGLDHAYGVTLPDREPSRLKRLVGRDAPADT